MIVENLIRVNSLFASISFHPRSARTPIEGTAVIKSFSVHMGSLFEDEIEHILLFLVQKIKQNDALSLLKTCLHEATYPPLIYSL